MHACSEVSRGRSLVHTVISPAFADFLAAWQNANSSRNSITGETNGSFWRAAVLAECGWLSKKRREKAGSKGWRVEPWLCQYCYVGGTGGCSDAVTQTPQARRERGRAVAKRTESGGTHDSDSAEAARRGELVLRHLSFDRSSKTRLTPDAAPLLSQGSLSSIGCHGTVTWLCTAVPHGAVWLIFVCCVSYSLMESGAVSVTCDVCCTQCRASVLVRTCCL